MLSCVRMQVYNFKFHMISFSIQFGNMLNSLCQSPFLRIGVFRLFAFSVIIGMLGLRSVFYLFFSVFVFCVFLPFIPVGYMNISFRIPFSSIALLSICPGQLFKWFLQVVHYMPNSLQSIIVNILPFQMKYRNLNSLPSPLVIQMS